MGFRTWLGLAEPRAEVTADVTAVSRDVWRQAMILAGYSPAQLQAGPVTEADAEKVPALTNGLSLLTGIAQQLPLLASPSGEADTFLAELDPEVPAGWTVAQTVKSVCLHEQAWWYVTARSARGFPRTVQWIHLSRIDVSNPEQPKVDQVPVNPRDLIRFSGVKRGLLSAGAEAISTALSNVRMARSYADNPHPRMILTDGDGMEPLEVAEAADYVTALADSIRAKGMAYAAGFKVDQYGWSASEIQLVEARNQDALEMARLLAMPPHYLAAPYTGSSLTYSNLTDVRRDLLEVGGLASYLVPIEQRLSMPDVTPRGTTVRFDADSFFLRVTPDAPTPQAAQQQANQGATP